MFHIRNEGSNKEMKKEGYIYIVLKNGEVFSKNAC